ncbi:MAG: trigger factor [Planctomycetota bacterium]
MDVQVAKTGPCAAKVTLTVASAEFQQQFDRDLRRIGKQVRLKGFRAGHVPAPVIEKMYGPSVERETIESFLKDALAKAVADEGFELAMQPQVDAEGFSFERGNDLELKIDLDLKPKFELGDYKGLEVERKPIEIEDGEVERTIEDVRRQQARPEVAGDDGLPAEYGMAIGKIEIVRDGEVVAGREGLRLSAESAPNGVDAEKWKAATVGAQEGSTVEVEMKLPDDWDQEELRGKDATCRVTFGQVYKLELPAREDLYQQFGVDDDAAFLGKVEEQLRAAKEDAERNRVETALMDLLVENHPFDLPQRMLQHQIESREAAAKQQMEQNGASEEEAQQHVDGHRDATREAAIKSLRAYYLVEAISLAENVEVKQSEIAEEMRRIAMRNRASFQQVKDYYEQQKLVPQLALELMERKVRRILHANAKGA